MDHRNLFSLYLLFYRLYIYFLFLEEVAESPRKYESDEWEHICRRHSSGSVSVSVTSDDDDGEWMVVKEKLVMASPGTTPSADSSDGPSVPTSQLEKLSLSDLSAASGSDKEGEVEEVRLGKGARSGIFEMVKCFQGHAAAVHSAAVSPSGEIFATAAADRSVRLWRLSGLASSRHCGETDGLLSLSAKVRIMHSVSFSPDGVFLAAGASDSIIYIWDLQMGVLSGSLKGHTKPVWSVSFSLLSGLLASGSWDHSIKIWDPSDGTCLVTLTGHTDCVCGVQFSPDGLLLASSSYDGTAGLWDVMSGTCRQSLVGHSGHVTAASFHPNGSQMATASWDKSVRKWAPKVGRPSEWTCLHTLQGHADIVNSVIYSLDGRFVASASRDKTIRIWSASADFCLQVLSGHAAAVTSITFAKNGYLLSTSDDHTVVVWEYE